MGPLQGPLPVGMDHTEVRLIHLGQKLYPWIGTTSTTTGMTPSADLTTAPTTALTETATVKWGRNVEHLDGGGETGAGTQCC
jgi:hypothetical protein